MQHTLKASCVALGLLAWGVASVMFDEDTRRKLSLVSSQEEVWSDLYKDRHHDSITSETLDTVEEEGRRSMIEGLQALENFIDPGPAG